MDQFISCVLPIIVSNRLVCFGSAEKLYKRGIFQGYEQQIITFKHIRIKLQQGRYRLQSLPEISRFLAAIQNYGAISHNHLASTHKRQPRCLKH